MPMAEMKPCPSEYGSFTVLPADMYEECVTPRSTSLLNTSWLFERRAACRLVLRLIADVLGAYSI